MIRPVTQNLIEAVGWDDWPRQAAIVDFGIDSTRHLGALQAVIRSGEASPEALDEALGDGPAHTRLVNDCRSNPYPGIVFKTAYDFLTPGSGVVK